MNLNPPKRICKVIREDIVSGRAAFDLDLAQALIDRKRDTPGATLPILHDLQEQFGYIDDRVIPLVADALNISRAETLGVISFYHDFHRSPVDGRVLKLCRAESCQSMGCEDLVSHLELRHGIKADDEDKYSGLHVETVYCLGNCACSPAAMIDGRLYGRVTAERFDELIAQASAAS